MITRFHIVNLGCRVNRVESDSFSETLASLGLIPSSLECADIVVVNTCTVTGIAEKKARKAVRHALASAPAAKVVVTGCASAIDPNEFGKMSDRVIVTPKAEMAQRLPMLARNLSGAGINSLSDQVSSAAHDAADASNPSAMRKATAHDGHAASTADAASDISADDDRERWGLKIQDGCSNECSYCIVRIARGPERSRPVEDVLAGAKRLAETGIPEIVFTGINLGRYRDGDCDLAGLLRLILDMNLGSRLRLSSIEPNNVSPKLIDLLAKADGRVCRYLHLPLQSGSTKVLDEMGRTYTAQDFEDLVRFAHDRIPPISITTDVIVGFPGETENDFEHTLELCRRCAFSKIHVFPYSERQGTPAAARKDQVPKDVRIQRAAILRSLASKLRASDRASRTGMIELAAVESPRRATTESYHEITPPHGAVTGTLVQVRM